MSLREKEPPEREAARQWWKSDPLREWGPKVICDSCNTQLHTGDGYLLDGRLMMMDVMGKGVKVNLGLELFCQACFEQYRYDPRDPIEFVPIPAGEFEMGGTKVDNEQPVHRVRISHGFEMGKYVVTQAQWEGLMGTTLRQQRDQGNKNWPLCGEGADYPMYYMSWEEAQEFCCKLNERGDGYTYRLPTEAEWEYACRAGSIGDYAGNLSDMAWYEGNCGGKTHPVGKKRANAWGLYDMHGNVWEWCGDWYAANYYERSPSTDPQGPSTGSHRVFRGGGWLDPATSCRSAHRGAATPGYRGNGFGFRLVRMRWVKTLANLAD